MPLAIEKRKYLVDALNEVVPQLHRVYAKEGKGGQACLFLQQVIATHSDDKTLEKIVVAVKSELASYEQTSSTT
jgi:hypothetical protein